MELLGSDHYGGIQGSKKAKFGKSSGAVLNKPTTAILKHLRLDKFDMACATSSLMLFWSQ